MAEVTGAEIRAWARANGCAVADEGRIPPDIVTAYGAAHRKRPVTQALTVGGPPSVKPENEPLASPPSPPEPAGTPPPPPPPTGRGEARPPPSAPVAPGPPDQPARGTDGFAITALVLGVLPICGLGLVFGIVALLRIRKSQRRGRGLAVGGMVLGVVWLVLGGLVAIFGEFEVEDDGPERAADGTVIGRGILPSSKLRFGDCPASLNEGALDRVEVVPCSQPHQAEVYDSFELSKTPYPGDGEVRRLGSGGCGTRVGAFITSGAADFAIHSLTPTEGSWRDGYRKVICMVGAVSGGMLPPGSAKVP